MTTVAIIQARRGATRLPGKVLADLSGRPVLEWVVRAIVATPGVDKVIVATSTNKADDRIVTWAANTGILCERGSETDVLERYHMVASRHQAEVVLRVTADCPLLDPAVAGQTLMLLKHTRVHYACHHDPPSW